MNRGETCYNCVLCLSGCNDDNSSDENDIDNSSLIQCKLGGESSRSFASFGHYEKIGDESSLVVIKNYVENPKGAPDSSDPVFFDIYCYGSQSIKIEDKTFNFTTVGFGGDCIVGCSRNYICAIVDENENSWLFTTEAQRALQPNCQSSVI